MPPEPAENRSVGLLVVRYGLGVALVIAGIVLVAVNPSGFGVDGFAMAVGGGLSVLLINFSQTPTGAGSIRFRAVEDARVGTSRTALPSPRAGILPYTASYCLALSR
jgi:hypothetical protein